MRIQVLLRLKTGVLDVQGKAVERGIHDIGFADVSNVRIGKLVEFDLPANTFEAAREQVDQICEKLLANTIIETYEVIPVGKGGGRAGRTSARPARGAEV